MRHRHDAHGVILSRREWPPRTSWEDADEGASVHSVGLRVAPRAGESLLLRLSVSVRWLGEWFEAQAMEGDRTFARTFFLEMVL